MYSKNNVKLDYFLIFKTYCLLENLLESLQLSSVDLRCKFRSELPCSTKNLSLYTKAAAVAKIKKS